MSRREEEPFLRRLMDRRRALTVLGVAGVSAVAAACSRSSTTSTEAGAPPSPGGGGTASPDCVLTPELTEGPYNIDLDKVRSDITEGRPGAAMKLAITVVDASRCLPLEGAAVDVWHCDAAGEYSGFGQAVGRMGPPGGGGGSRPTDDKRFLRGTLMTDAAGLATFETIYPGWYTGRTVHIHVKVHAGGREVHTGQLFFDDDVTDTVYERAPYASRADRDTRNAGDGIFGQASGSGLVTIKSAGNGYDAAIALGVKTA